LIPKIAQMLIIGFLGENLTANDQFAEELMEFSPGGVVLFNRPSNQEYSNIINPRQLLNLTHKIKKYSKISPFIAVDQEGGKVARLNPKTGFSSSKSARYIGNKNDLSTTEKWAENIASDLKKAGINLNFAPVIDLDQYSSSPAIGLHDRSFSQSDEVVIKHAQVFCNAMKKKKIYCCLKHFPGHGSASIDSHLGFTDITSSWQQKELEPYKRLCRNHAGDLVMVAHVFHRDFDQKYPASLSKIIIGNLLKTELDCDYPVITDDLQMRAITDHFSLKETIRLAVLAGNDLLLFANSKPDNYLSVTKFISLMLELVNSGDIPVSMIDQSYQRIKNLKSKFIDT